ncbi:hypothetical protein Hdeb2414_s0023g00625201 [Helianthus debilis subsp. tardiflorus]
MRGFYTPTYLTDEEMIASGSQIAQQDQKNIFMRSFSTNSMREEYKRHSPPSPRSINSAREEYKQRSPPTSPKSFGIVSLCSFLL